MKKFITIILIFMLLFVSTIVTADGSIKVYFNNKQISSDVSPYIESSHTLVPIRMVSEAFSYDVLWNDKTRVVTVKSPDSTILLTIGSDEAIVNNQKVKLNATAVIHDNRTFIPIRFISENFGYDVAWDSIDRSVIIKTAAATPKPTSKPTPKPNTTSTIGISKIDFSRVGTAFSVIITADAPIKEIKSFKMDNPYRFVVDIENAVLNDKNNPIPIQSENIAQIRFSQYTKSPDVVRVVIDLNKDVPIKTDVNKNTCTLTLTDSLTKITKITAKTDADKDILTIQSNAKLNFEVFSLVDPNRVVVDFLNADIKAEKIVFSGNTVKDVSFFKHPDKTRVTITTKAPVNYTTKNENNTFTISMAEKGQGGGVFVDQRLIVIDSGHGDTDPGSLGKINGKVVLEEKVINLKIANRMAEILKSQGYNILQTRTTDKFLPLGTIVDIANSSNASLFVSVHNNSFESSNAYGTLTMYGYDTKKAGTTMSDKQAATIMQKELIKGTEGYNRNLLDGSKIYVLKHTKMPAILLECLFMSNANDLAKLMNPDYVEKIAVNAANGIKNIMASMPQ